MLRNPPAYRMRPVRFRRRSGNVPHGCSWLLPPDMLHRAPFPGQMPPLVMDEDLAPRTHPTKRLSVLRHGSSPSSTRRHNGFRFTGSKV